MINIQDDVDRKAIAYLFEKRIGKLNGKLNRMLELHYDLYIRNKDINLSEDTFNEIFYNVLNSSLDLEFETSQELVKLELIKNL